jgi:hypothetical protein
MRPFLFVLATLLIGVVALQGYAAAQTQVPNPVLRPQKAPNPNAKLPVPAPAPAAATATKSAAPVTASGPYTNGRVIVLRGLANVFSRGMDKLAKDLKAQGVPVTLSNHSRWQMIAADLIKDYKANPKQTAPIILIGHSLGGDASIVMSNWLAQNGVPVRFVVIFDAVAQTHPIIGGVQEVLNFYKPKGYGQEVKPAPSFRGEIRNVDLTDRKDIDHLNIDEDPVLQGEVTADVLRILNEGNKPARKSTPVAKAAPPAEPAAAPADAQAATAPAPGTAPAGAEPTAPAAAATPPAAPAPAAAATPPAAPAPAAAAATPPAQPAPAPAAAAPAPAPATEPVAVTAPAAVIKAAPAEAPATATPEAVPAAAD